MNFETRQSYAEIYEILQYMPDEYVKKIPRKLIELFQTEKLEDCEIKINKKNPLDRNYLSKKTLILISILNYNYWCPNKKIKDELYKRYLSNNEKYKIDLHKKI